MKEKVTCPSCQGRRFAIAHINRGSSRNHTIEKVKCHVCGGEGEITQNYHDQIMEGRKLRSARVDKGVSIRERAARLGNVTATELSHWENPPRERPLTSAKIPSYLWEGL
jgi:DNA-binding transcriptional regulator YiaG